MSVCSQINIEGIVSKECIGPSLDKINNNFQNLNNYVCALRDRVDSSVEIRTFFYYGPNSQVAPAAGMDSNQLSRPSDITIEAFVNSPDQLNLSRISESGDIAYVIYQKSGFQGAEPSQNSGFNRETGRPENYATGRPVVLTLGTWYDVDEYYSVTGVLEGEQPDIVGTLVLKFMSPTGEISTFEYTPSETSSDTYIELNPDSVISSEGFPEQQVIKKIEPRPFKALPGVKFMYLTRGLYNSYYITGFLRKTTIKSYVEFNITETDFTTEFLPTFIIWKLQNIEGIYYVEVGFPKFSNSLGSTNGAPNVNWNQPQNWSTFDSWPV